MKNTTACPCCGKVLNATLKKYGLLGGKVKAYTCYDCGYNVTERELTVSELNERDLWRKSHDSLKDLNLKEIEKE